MYDGVNELVVQLSAIIGSYFSELVASLEKLSHKAEKSIPNLPSWALCHRNIFIGHVLGTDFYIIKTIPDESQDRDKIFMVDIATKIELESFLPFNLIGNSEKAFNAGLSFSDVKLICDDPFGPSTYVFKGMITFTQFQKINDIYSQENAKRDAINIWNESATGIKPTKNFIDELRKIFAKFNSVINQKSFKERKIHRYIDNYAKFLLPNFKLHYFEHELILKGDKQKADFILQRENGFPPMLIELENPKSKMFKNNGEWSYAANHAKYQIAEWVKFIDQNPENANGKMDFLTGPNKERLVIMGRGLNFLDKMKDSKYSDTIMWTYDLMINEAKENWEKIIINQCKLLNLDPPELF